MRFVVITLFCGLILTACGQTGPLYLPEDAAPKPPTVESPTAAPTPTTSAP